MPNNISSTIHPVDIVLVIAALAIAFIALYKIVSFINSRPDLIAFAGLAIIIIGGVGIVSGSAELAGGWMMLGGALSFLLAALIYSKNKPSPTPQKPVESTQDIDINALTKEQLIQVLNQLGGAK